MSHLLPEDISLFYQRLDRLKESMKVPGNPQSRSRSPGERRPGSPRRPRSRSPRRSPSRSPRRIRSRSPRRFRSRSPRRLPPRSPRRSRIRSPQRPRSRNTERSGSRGRRRSADPPRAARNCVIPRAYRPTSGDTFHRLPTVEARFAGELAAIERDFPQPVSERPINIQRRRDYLIKALTAGAVDSMPTARDGELSRRQTERERREVISTRELIPRLEDRRYSKRARERNSADDKSKSSLSKESTDVTSGKGSPKDAKSKNSRGDAKSHGDAKSKSSSDKGSSITGPHSSEKQKAAASIPVENNGKPAKTKAAELVELSDDDSPKAAPSALAVPEEEPPPYCPKGGLNLGDKVKPVDQKLAEMKAIERDFPKFNKCPGRVLRRYEWLVITRMALSPTAGGETAPSVVDNSGPKSQPKPGTKTVSTAPSVDKSGPKSQPKSTTKDSSTPKSQPKANTTTQQKSSEPSGNSSAGSKSQLLTTTNHSSSAEPKKPSNGAEVKQPMDTSSRSEKKTAPNPDPWKKSRVLIQEADVLMDKTSTAKEPSKQPVSEPSTSSKPTEAANGIPSVNRQPVPNPNPNASSTPKPTPPPPVGPFKSHGYFVPNPHPQPTSAVPESWLNWYQASAPLVTRPWTGTVSQTFGSSPSAPLVAATFGIPVSTIGSTSVYGQTLSVPSVATSTSWPQPVAPVSQASLGQMTVDPTLFQQYAGLTGTIPAPNLPHSQTPADATFEGSESSASSSQRDQASLSRSPSSSCVDLDSGSERSGSDTDESVQSADESNDETVPAEEAVKPSGQETTEKDVTIDLESLEALLEALIQQQGGSQNSEVDVQIAGLRDLISQKKAEKDVALLAKMLAELPEAEREPATADVSADLPSPDPNRKRSHNRRGRKDAEAKQRTQDSREDEKPPVSSNEQIPATVDLTQVLSGIPPEEMAKLPKDLWSALWAAGGTASLVLASEILNYVAPNCPMKKFVDIALAATGQSNKAKPKSKERSREPKSRARSRDKRSPEKRRRLNKRSPVRRQRSDKGSPPRRRSLAPPSSKSVDVSRFAYRKLLQREKDLDLPLKTSRRERLHLMKKASKKTFSRDKYAERFEPTHRQDTRAAPRHRQDKPSSRTKPAASSQSKPGAPIPADSAAPVKSDDKGLLTLADLTTPSVSYHPAHSQANPAAPAKSRPPSLLESMFLKPESCQMSEPIRCFPSVVVGRRWLNLAIKLNDAIDTDRCLKTVME